MGGTIAIGVFSLFLNLVQLDVPLYDQTVKYQTACESVATVATLNYFGYDITIDEFLDSYLDIIEARNVEFSVNGHNIFDVYFVGNPRTYNGWLCYPPVIVKAVERYFSNIDEKYRRPYNCTGYSFNSLLDEVSKGNPVVVWITQGCQESEIVDFKGSEYVALNHAVVLSGYDRNRGVVLITDSIDGSLELDYNVVKNVFDFAGKRSVVIK